MSGSTYKETAQGAAMKVAIVEGDSGGGAGGAGAVGPGTADAAQRTTLASDSPGVDSLSTIAQSSIIAPIPAHFGQSSHIEISSLAAIRLSIPESFCESVVLWPQRADGSPNVAAIRVGVTGQRQHVLLNPGDTIGPFPGRKIDLRDIRVLGAVGDGVEFWVVQ